MATRHITYTQIIDGKTKLRTRNGDFTVECVIKLIRGDGWISIYFKGNPVPVDYRTNDTFSEVV